MNGEFRTSVDMIQKFPVFASTFLQLNIIDTKENILQAIKFTPQVQKLVIYLARSELNVDIPTNYPALVLPHLHTLKLSTITSISMSELFQFIMEKVGNRIQRIKIEISGTERWQILGAKAVGTHVPKIRYVSLSLPNLMYPNAAEVINILTLNNVRVRKLTLCTPTQEQQGLCSALHNFLQQSSAQLQEIAFLNPYYGGSWPCSFLPSQLPNLDKVTIKAPAIWTWSEASNFFPFQDAKHLILVKYPTFSTLSTTIELHRIFPNLDSLNCEIKDAEILVHVATYFPNLFQLHLRFSENYAPGQTRMPSLLKMKSQSKVLRRCNFLIHNFKKPASLFYWLTLTKIELK